nr:ATP-binding protein [Kitasatospora fiedleri]
MQHNSPPAGHLAAEQLVGEQRPAGGRLVGREAELSVLTRAVLALERGRGSVVELPGEPGIGKTRLAGALLELAARRGVPVARAHARHDGTGPWQVFRDARESAGGAGEAEQRLDGPEQRLDGPEQRLDRPEQRLDAPEQRLDGPGDRPLAWAAGHLVVLDDVHLCDPASTALLVRLVRSVTPAPFLLAVAHRPGQTAPALRAALQDGVRAGTVTRVEPRALTAEEVAVLLADRPADGEPGARTPAELRAFAARLCTAAEGNPRYLRLLVAARWQPEHWPERAGTDPAGLLRAAKPLVAELDALTPPAALTASAAAVAGSPFRPEDVARLSGLGADRTLDALAELEEAGLVRQADWQGRLAFRHPVVGHVAHERAGLSFRLRAHRHALELITGRDGRARDRARHAEHLLGSDAALAARTLADGAAEIAALEPATAARWLGLALEALPDGGDGAADAAARNAMELARCRALIASGHPGEARTRAHELLGRRAATLDERQLCQAYAVCVGAERQLGRYAEAAALADAALRLLPRPLPSPLPAEAAELVIEHGLVHVLRGTHDQARALLREAVRVPTAADGHGCDPGPASSHENGNGNGDRYGDGDADGATEPDRTVLRVLDALCVTHAGDLAEALDEVTHCARLVDALPDPMAGRTPETLALLGSAELYLERFADAARHLSRGLTADRQELTADHRGPTADHRRPATDHCGPTADRRRPQRPVLLHRLLGLAVAEQWTGRLESSRQHAMEARTSPAAWGCGPRWPWRGRSARRRSSGPVAGRAPPTPWRWSRRRRRRPRPATAGGRPRRPACSPRPGCSAVTRPGAGGPCWTAGRRAAAPGPALLPAVPAGRAGDRHPGVRGPGGGGAAGPDRRGGGPAARAARPGGPRAVRPGPAPAGRRRPRRGGRALRPGRGGVPVRRDAGAVRLDAGDRRPRLSRGARPGRGPRPPGRGRGGRPDAPGTARDGAGDPRPRRTVDGLPHRAPARPAQRPRTGDRRAGRDGAAYPRDRRAALPQPPHGGDPPVPRLPQTRRPVPARPVRPPAPDRVTG